MASRDNRASSKPGNKIKSPHFLSAALLLLTSEGGLVADLSPWEVFDYMSGKSEINSGIFTTQQKLLL